MVVALQCPLLLSNLGFALVTWLSGRSPQGFKNRITVLKLVGLQAGFLGSGTAFLFPFRNLEITYLKEVICLSGTLPKEGPGERVQQAALQLSPANCSGTWLFSCIYLSS